MRISVIMASYLGEYTAGPHKSATNREFKFRRAVNSFLYQTFKDAELIIISDGCNTTNKIVKSEYIHSSIKLIELEKQPMFSGKVRQTGLELAVGEIMCYLDTDDVLGENHLSVINTFDDKNFVWCYYDDYLYDGKEKQVRNVRPECQFIGTSAICHKRNSPFKWYDGYGHDWASIEKILSLKNYKLKTPEYIVCHVCGLGIEA